MLLITVNLLDAWFDEQTMQKVLIGLFDKLSVPYLDSNLMNLPIHPELIR